MAEWKRSRKGWVFHADNGHGRPVCNAAMQEGLVYDAPEGWSHTRPSTRGGDHPLQVANVECCWRCVAWLQARGRWPHDD